MKIIVENMVGMFPRVQSERLMENAADLAVNVRTGDGYVEPYRAPSVVENPNPGYDIKTIYRYHDGVNYTWLTWPEAVDITRGQVTQDKYRRLYWTSSAGPRMADQEMIRRGNILNYQLGVPEPVEPLAVGSITNQTRNTISVGGTGPASTNVPAGAAVFQLNGDASPFEPNAYVEGIHRIPNDNDEARAFYGYVEYLDAGNEFILRDINGVLIEQDFLDAEYLTDFFSFGLGSAFSAIPVRYYAYSFVSYHGERGPLHLLDEEYFVRDGSTVTLSLPPMTLPVNVNRIQLWRTVPSGTDSDEFHLVDEWYDLVKAFGGPSHLSIPQAEQNDYQYLTLTAGSTLIDNKSNLQVSINEVAGSNSYDPPRPDSHSMTALTNGITAMAAGNMLQVSPPGLPHAYPALWRKALPEEIVGLSYVSNSVIVMTEADVYLANVIDPENVQIEALHGGYGCVSKASIATVPGYGALFSTAVGMYMAGLDGARNVTRDYIDADQWKDLNPELIEGEFHENKYFGWWVGTDRQVIKGFVLDFKRPDTGLVWLDEPMKALYMDPIDDQLYGVSGNAIAQWNAGDRLNGTWRSKKYDPDQDAVFEWFEIDSQRDTNHSIKLIDGYTDREFDAFDTIGNEPERVTCHRTDEYQIEVSGPQRWRRAKLAETTVEL